jgi:ABC-2 type transport system permease protein
MKLLAITFKDMTRSFRSVFALAFMFGVPLLVTGMFYLMFGSSAGDDSDAFNLPRTRVVIVNLDEGSLYFSANAGADESTDLKEIGVDMSQVRNMGDILAQMLAGPQMSDLVDVSSAVDAQAARTAVDNQEAGIALIIPADFTRALIEPGAEASVELYHDPTLTLAPGIVSSLVERFIDSAAGAKLGLEGINAQMNAAGLPLDPLQQQSLAQQLIERSSGHSDGAVNLRAPDGQVQKADPLAAMLGLIMGGMTVFYAFYTGATSAQTIMTEQEKGTLQRLFTTPVSTATVLGGKYLATGLTVLVQMIVLLVFGSLIFNVRWGALPETALVILGTALTATSMGIFLISLLKTDKQVGMVFGVGLTITGMVGIFSAFTGGAVAATSVASRMALFVPQGWSMTALRAGMAGDGLVGVLPYFLGMLAWSAVFFFIGVRRFNKRFA